MNHIQRFGRFSGIRTARLCRVAAFLFLVLGMPILFSGCATPNLKPFADGAASFSASVRQTNTDVESRFSGAAGADQQLAKLLASYSSAAKIYNGMAGLAAGYSSAVAELGAAGETGGQAADQLLQTVNGFADFLGVSVAGLPASLAGSVAGRAIKQAAVAWTRLQAQKDLLTTMTAADPAVQKLSQAMVAVYGRPYQKNGVTKLRPFERIVRDIVRQERIALKNGIGASKLSFFEAVGRASEQGVYAEADKKLYANNPVAAAKAFDGAMGKLIAQRERIQGEVATYREADENLMAWQAQQIKAAYLIADTATAWAAEHQRLLAWFATCGGTRVLRNDCGQFSAASLNALASEIQYIVKGEQ